MNVSFRFYAQLNDFLAADRRGRRFVHALRNVTSVKDAIEALGVPHPEVDLILVNGTARSFAALLHEGDDVSVYPDFKSLDVAGSERVGARPSRPVRFAGDLHLGRLIALLRLAGFDTVTIGDDASLAGAAAREDRVALTRDVALLKRRVIRHGYWVREIDPERQLAEVLERFGLAGQVQPFTRCLRCNTCLVAADAAAVADRLLPRTLENFREFCRCPGCQRVYWKGSHYGPLRRILERAGCRARS